MKNIGASTITMGFPNFKNIFTALAILSMTVIAAGSAGAQTYNVIHTFTGGLDGSGPIAGLSSDRMGNFYGTTAAGGNSSLCMGNGCGAVYQLAKRNSTWVLLPIYDFQGDQDGSYPAARVIVGPGGALFGITTYGGDGPCTDRFQRPGCGTIFELTPPAEVCRTVICPWTKTILHSFDGIQPGSHGGYPMGEVVFDQAGNFYGTTPAGGSNGLGVAYKMTRSGSGWTYSVLFNFTYAGGLGGSSGLIFDQAGNLYGTAPFGGPGGAGTVFELSPSGNGWTESVLYAFPADHSSGANPTGGLIFDPSGNLFGTTSGWQNQAGTAFELKPSGGGWTFSVITVFPDYGCMICNSGSVASLVRDGAGNLYGTSPGDGVQGFGEIFRLAPNGNAYTYQVLYEFMGMADGAGPEGNLLPDGHGNYLSTASFEGEHLGGVIFEITP